MPAKKSAAERGKIARSELGGWMTRVPSWKGKDRRSAIQRTFTLPDFRCALGFVGFVGELAEAHDHHPDIDVRYNKVTLTLSTHSAGGLTPKDFELASLIGP